MARAEKTKPASKEATLRRLSASVFKLEANKGHLGWKVTDLSRSAKVSRSVIYQYLGSSKEQILTSAFNNFISEFYGFANVETDLSMAEQIKNAREQMILNPEPILFYQKWRATNSWLQQEFMKIEVLFRERLQKEYPDLSPAQILALHTMIHGLVTAPFLSGDEAKLNFQNLIKAL